MKKILMIVIFAAIVGVFTLVDWGITCSYDIELVKVNPEEPYMDNKTPVEITLRVTRKGNPVEGHDILATALKGGSFTAYRVVTDADGLATFIYWPLKLSRFNPLQDAVIQFQDESNSVIIYLPKTETFTIKLRDPAEAVRTDEE